MARLPRGVTPQKTCKTRRVRTGALASSMALVIPRYQAWYGEAGILACGSFVMLQGMHCPD